MQCVQVCGTRERKVGHLLNIISHRSDRHFKLFIGALVEAKQDDFAKLLDEELAEDFIKRRYAGTMIIFTALLHHPVLVWLTTVISQIT